VQVAPLADGQMA
jgi:hypothetical protein